MGSDVAATFVRLLDMGNGSGAIVAPSGFGRAHAAVWMGLSNSGDVKIENGHRRPLEWLIGAAIKASVVGECGISGTASEVKPVARNASCGRGRMPIAAQARARTGGTFPEPKTGENLTLGGRES